LIRSALLPPPLAGPRPFRDPRQPPCFTPVQSPESNGIAESFVKTFKRDYARVNALPDALTALRQIAGWFEDYNDNHPHSGLKMRSPREFIRAQPQ